MTKVVPLSRLAITCGRRRRPSGLWPVRRHQNHTIVTATSPRVHTPVAQPTAGLGLSNRLRLPALRRERLHGQSSLWRVWPSLIVIEVRLGNCLLRVELLPFLPLMLNGSSVYSARPNVGDPRLFLPGHDKAVSTVDRAVPKEGGQGRFRDRVVVWWASMV